MLLADTIPTTRRQRIICTISVVTLAPARRCLWDCQHFFGTFVPTRQKTQNKAIFGNIDFDLSDQFTVHAGARHTWTDTDFNGCMRDMDGGFANFINVIGRRINPGFIPVQRDGCVTISTATRRREFTRTR